MALMQECDQIIHAGDPDDEGQFLIDEILDYAQNEKRSNGYISMTIRRQISKRPFMI